MPDDRGLEVGGPRYGHDFQPAPVKQGVLRKHMILPDGRIRHSAFYSILETEWEGVKKNLEEMMKKYHA